MSVEDLCTCQGVVVGRAATILQSIENQPFDWMMSCELDESCAGRRAFGIFFYVIQVVGGLGTPLGFSCLSFNFIKHVLYNCTPMASKQEHYRFSKKFEWHKSSCLVSQKGFSQFAIIIINGFKQKDEKYR